jgi:hypothetical protein
MPAHNRVIQLSLLHHVTPELNKEDLEAARARVSFHRFRGDLDWIDASRLPPRSLVAGAMHRAMMDTA